jgi:hypothetical protein
MQFLKRSPNVVRSRTIQGGSRLAYFRSMPGTFSGCFRSDETMNNKFSITQIVSVEAVESERFEVRLLLEDTSEVVLTMDGATLCSLADMVSQYATP